MFNIILFYNDLSFNNLFYDFVHVHLNGKIFSKIEMGEFADCVITIPISLQGS